MGRVNTFCAKDLFTFLVKTTDESEISVRQKFSASKYFQPQG